MIKKEQEKLKAIELRKKGFSYNEILEKIDVSKSTLSVWLKNIGIAKKQAQRLTLKRKLAQKKAQEACRNYRINREKEIIELSKNDVKNISQRELWLIGITLYWAEGAKQKENNVSQRVSLTNTDPNMILLFDRWLKTVCKIEKKDIYYCLYIHKTANIKKAKLFWEKLLNVTIEFVYIKKHNPESSRKYFKDYNGLLRIDIKRSTDFNRKIKGWTLGIANDLKCNAR